MPSSLPPPEAAALAHSERLVALIGERIAREGGWISFADYMQLALYAPALGYYAAGSRKLGAAGDFTTAPEMTPLFGQAIAGQAAQVLQCCGGDILELGPGSGRLAVDLLRRLQVLERLPERYLLLEPSPDLRQRQAALMAQELPELFARCAWLDTLPEHFTGFICGNEVLDALPVELLRLDETGFWQRGVAVAAQGGLQWSDRPLRDGPLLLLAQDRLAGFTGVTEINLAGEGLVCSLGVMLERGMLLLLDYGFPQLEFYHPQRQEGTLRCHYRHHAHDDPFYLPGLQDITAHVDFTAMAHAAADTGLALVGYTSQAQFLVNCGLLERLEACGEPGQSPYLRAASAVQRLTHPAEMGELFKAIAWSRGIDILPCGFAQGDRSFRL